MQAGRVVAVVVVVTSHALFAVTQAASFETSEHTTDSRVSMLTARQGGVEQQRSALLLRFLVVCLSDRLGSKATGWTAMTGWTRPEQDTELDGPSKLREDECENL